MMLDSVTSSPTISIYCYLLQMQKVSVHGHSARLVRLVHYLEILVQIRLFALEQYVKKTIAISVNLA